MIYRNIAALILLLMWGVRGLCQSPDLAATRSRMQGLWLSKGDSVSELQVSGDSITTFRFRLNGVTSCSFKLVAQPCEKVLRFPAATGIYMVEHYKDKDICCALSKIEPAEMRIIYPGGSEITYINEKTLPQGK